MEEARCCLTSKDYFVHLKVYTFALTSCMTVSWLEPLFEVMWCFNIDEEGLTVFTVILRFDVLTGDGKLQYFHYNIYNIPL